MAMQSSLASGVGTPLTWLCTQASELLQPQKSLVVWGCADLTSTGCLASEAALHLVQQGLALNTNDGFF